MEFWASSETFEPADTATERCRQCFESHLGGAFKTTILKSLTVEFRYIPIVMPKDMHDKYTERSKLRRKARIIDCAPQLDFETFVNGSFKEQLIEYTRGIATCTPMLAKLGATPEQVAVFEEILSHAVDRIMEERPDLTRH